MIQKIPFHELTTVPYLRRKLFPLSSTLYFQHSFRSSQVSRGWKFIALCQNHLCIYHQYSLICYLKYYFYPLSIMPLFMLQSFSAGVMCFECVVYSTPPLKGIAQFVFPGPVPESHSTTFSLHLHRISSYLSTDKQIKAPTYYR